MKAALHAAGVVVDVRGEPVGSRALTVLLLHGRDQDPAWIYDHVLDRLTEHLSDVPITWAAPAAPGRSWYAGRVHDSLDRTAAERDRAADVVDGLVDLLAPGRRDPVVLAGFSQGACLVADQLVRGRRRWAGAVVWTGAAFGPVGTPWPAPPGPASLADLPVLLTNGDADPWVPLAATEALADALRLRGAEVELRVQPGRGHEVADDEIAAAAALLRRVAGG
jgi:phospholipase/carboxylesterase